MSNRTSLTNHEWSNGIHMQGTIILYIGVTPDDDGRTIATHYRVIPDAGSLVNGHVANNHGSWCDKYILCNCWPYTLKRKNWHKSLPLNQFKNAPFVTTELQSRQVDVLFPVRRGR